MSSWWVMIRTLQWSKKVLETFYERLWDWPFSGAQHCLAQLLQFLQILFPFRRSLHLPWGPLQGPLGPKGCQNGRKTGSDHFHGSSRKTICVRVSKQSWHATKSGLMEKELKKWGVISDGINKVIQVATAAIVRYRPLQIVRPRDQGDISNMKPSGRSLESCGPY